MRISFSGELAYEVNVCAERGAARLGSADGRRRRARHHAVRHRDDARAARREGLHHRRPGHRRLGDADRSRHGLDRRQEQEGLPRPTLARARRHGARRPQAARRPPDRRSRARAAGRRADRRRRLGAASPVPMLGHVTSSYFSTYLKRSIALALVKGGRKRNGEKVRDPAGERTRDPRGDRGASVRRSRRSAPECLIRCRARALSCASTSRRGESGTVARGGAGIVVRERAFLGHINVRGDPNDPHFAAAVERALGLAPPTAPNTVNEAARQHRVLARSRRMADRDAGERGTALERELRTALGGVRAAVTDVSGGQTVVRPARPATCASCSRRAVRSTCIRACSTSGNARRAISPRRRS